MAANHIADWKPLFLAALAEWPVVTHACETAGVATRTAYRARETDSEFADAWAKALEDGVDKAEAEAWRRAVIGVDEPVIHKGQLAVGPDGTPLTIRRYSDRLLELLLRGRRKSVYSTRIEQTGADGAPLLPANENERAMRIEALLALAAQRKAGGADLC